MEIIILIGAIQALFFAILVYSKNHKNSADNVLGVWLSIMFTMLFLSYAAMRFPKFAMLGALSGFLFPVISIWLFIYTKTITGRTFKWRYLLHLFSILLIIASALPLQLTSGFEGIEKQSANNAISIYIILLGLVNFGVFTSYCIAAILEIKKHKSKIKLEFSFEEDINLRWLENINYSLLLVALLIISIFTLFLRGNLIVYEVDIYAFVTVSIFIFFIGFWGLKQGVIFPHKVIQQQVEQTTTKPIKEVTSEEDFEQRLHQIMLSDKLYLNPKLTLYDLSVALRESPREITRHLNQHRKTNFYEFVNKYRVEEAKKQLSANNQKFTILSIAFDCGFNSKASFNRVFKQSTGLTPTQFISK